MLRFLSFQHVFTYAFLVLLVIAVRLPSFHAQFYTDDESCYLTAAARMVDGGVQYVDTWDNKPPVIGWFYMFWVWILGDYAIYAIRVFTILYILAGALLLNYLTVSNKLTTSFSLLPAFFYIIICSVPWYAQEMNAELLLSIPAILAFMQVFRLGDDVQKNNHILFTAGLLLGLCFMIKYQAIFLFLGVLGAYLINHPPRFSESFSLFSGFSLFVGVIFLVLYFKGAFPAFWDIGILYNLDYIFIGRNPGEQIQVWVNLRAYAELWGALLVFGLIGIAHYRFSFYKNAIRLRKVEQIVLVWFSAALLAILIGGGRLYLHYFYLLAAPLSIYAAKFFELPFRWPWLRSALFGLGMAFPVLTFITWLYLIFPNALGFLNDYYRPGGWVRTDLHALLQPHPLEGKIDRAAIRNGILVMDYDPAVYTRLHLPCATKYTNFSIAYFKIELFGQPETADLISRPETTADVLRAMRADMPDCFLDRYGLFPKLQDAIPMLFDSYKVKSVQGDNSGYTIYCRD